MISYKIATPDDVDDFINLRIEFECCMYNSDDRSQFIGAFSQATEDFSKTATIPPRLPMTAKKQLVALHYVTLRLCRRQTGFRESGRI